MTAALAEQAPWWRPGSAHGYHAITDVWPVGELAPGPVSMGAGPNMLARWPRPSATHGSDRRAAELAAANGHTHATALARIYAALAGGGERVQASQSARLVPLGAR